MTVAAPVENFRLTAALDYISRGWWVFPLHYPKIGMSGKATCSCGKSNCGSVGKHPITENGFKNASNDEAQIRQWWSQSTSANIGLVTGAKSGIVVIDIDVDKGGMETFTELTDAYGQFPETVEVRTGGGGMHFYFQHPGWDFKNSSSRIGKGIDVRGDGGYVVAPPSLHEKAKRYEWLNGASPDGSTLAEIPEWVVELLKVKELPKQQPIVRGSSEDGQHWLGKALAKCNIGNRNETGFWLATQLRDAGMSEREASGFMRDYASRCPRGDSPYQEHEALASLRSAYSEPAREPAKGSGSAKPYRKPERDIEPPQVEVKPVESPSLELSKYINKVVAGEIYNVPLPWSQTTRLTDCGLPGSVTTVCGDPGVGKTFLILQCLQFWHDNNHNAAAYFIEKNRRFHTMRLLAQLEGSGHYVDHGWIKDNGEKVALAMERHRTRIDDIGQHIHSSEGKPVSLDTLVGWTKEQLSGGRRMLVIDPVTAANAGAERWDADQHFMLKVESKVTEYGASLILVTHPKKGNRPGASTGHDQAGGAAYFRFADTSIWLHRPKKPRKVQYQTRMGPASSHIPIFFQLHKTRNGKGAGMEIGFTFGEGLMFAEQGIVLKELKAESPPENIHDPF